MNPPLERSSAAAADRHRLAWATWPADLHSPVRVFLALREAAWEPCLLESAEGPARLARYSFLGLEPELRFRGGPGGCRLEGTGAGDGVETLDGPSHAALRELAARTVSPAPPPELPPFCGGWIGFVGYEWAGTLEPRVARAAHDPWQMPEAVFAYYRTVVAFDNAAQKLHVIRACPSGAADHGRAMERIDAVAADLSREPGEGGDFRSLDDTPRCNVERGRYEEGVERLRAAIREGEIFQGVLSQRFDQRFEGDPFTLYRVLRLTNPAPHMFYFQNGDFVLAGSSPERLVAVRGGRVENRPIAGTRPRHDDPDEDARLGAELLGDVKERAEHDMLVDLARNDLGRVARFGTVAVKEHAALEKFARVQHLVSRVECSLAAGKDALDALAACFPAGTVSGAPKVRAMELLSGLEPDTRGAYAGAFGYLDGRGGLDMCIVLRTFVIRGETLSVQAGAGIVFDSVPEREYEETLHKASALHEAVRLAGSPAFQTSGSTAGAAAQS